MTYGTYGYCVYHEIECDYPGPCRDCSHNTEEDTEWFEQDEERAEAEVSKPEVKPPKCSSTESSSVVDEANIELLDELYNENAELRKKLKKARKEKKRWKRKYLELEESFTVIYYIDKDGYISDKRTDRYCIPIKRMKV